MQINLLSPQTLVKTQQGLEKSTKNIALVGGGLTLIFLLTAGVLGLLDFQIKSKIETVQKDLDALSPVVRQMEEQKRLHQDLVNKDSHLKDLYNGRPLWTPHINEIKRLLPGNMTLSAIAFDRQKGEWKIEGIAPAYDQIAQFSTGLQGSTYFGKGLISDSFINTDRPGVSFIISVVTAGGEQK